MIDALFSDSIYVGAKKMLDVSTLRHEAIASNIANIETPNYKRLDVSKSFESELSRAAASQDSAAMMNMQPSLSVDATANAGRTDGNTVDLEREMLNLNQNMVEHSMDTQLVSGQLAKMRMAITGKS